VKPMRVRLGCPTCKTSMSVVPMSPAARSWYVHRPSPLDEHATHAANVGGVLLLVWAEELLPPLPWGSRATSGGEEEEEERWEGSETLFGRKDGRANVRRRYFGL
jgi:hypothetical protein